MKLRRNPPRRPAASLAARTSLAALALLWPAAEARAQNRNADPVEGYRILAQRRMELSQRAVSETQRRRFEEGKTNTQFPSDAARRAGARPGVLRALTPEQQKALAHNEKGLALFGGRKFEQALREYGAALRLDPELAAAHNNSGSALFALGRFQEAADSFGRALKVDPHYGQAHFNLALAHVKLGREQEANASLMGAVRAYLKTGDGLLREGRLEEAAAAYSELLRIDAEYPPARLRLGLVYNADRRFEAALEEFRRVVRAQPDNADAHEGFAEAYFGLRKYAESVAAADRAIALAPKGAGAYYLAGLAHAARGERQQALARHARLVELGSADYAGRLMEVIEGKAGEKK
jgi:tetratricopeptide (TPR) repeat protein